MLRFIDLRRGEGVSTLEVPNDHKPDGLIVLGNIPHGVDIAPRNVKAALELIEWLEGWIERAERRG